GRGRRPPDHLLRPHRDLPAAAAEGPDRPGQQHLQRLAFRGYLARPIERGALPEEMPMTRWPGILPLLAVALTAGAAHAQKPGGVLVMSHFDSPASMSPHEEATAAVNRPMMGVFNNLVLYDQHVAQNSLKSIVPELATGWSWSEDGTELTFPL